MWLSRESAVWHFEILNDPWMSNCKPQRLRGGDVYQKHEERLRDAAGSVVTARTRVHQWFAMS